MKVASALRLTSSSEYFHPALNAATIAGASYSDRQYREILNLISPSLSAMSAAFQVQAYRLHGSFLGGVLEQIQDIAEADDEEELEQGVSALEKAFYGAIAKQPANIISHDALISLLVSVVLAIYAQWFGDRTENRLNTRTDQAEKRSTVRIHEAEKRILERIESLKPPQVKETFYVVLHRPAQLRTNPTSKAVIVDRLFPNQTDALIRAKGKWIEVRYFDYIDGEPKTGWVMKKYLKRVQK